MPFHLPAVSRRAFMAQSSAALASLAVWNSSWAAETSDPHSLALLSDTHIPSGPDVVARDVNMTNNLKQVVAELCQLKQKPAGVIINGDCAYLKGLPEDYANLASLLPPLQSAGYPIHVTMGNHDHREHLFAALSNTRPEQPLLETKHVTVLKLPHANLFLLDTLKEVNVVTGELGEEQLHWLAKALDQHADKPAVLVAHHTPQFQPPEPGKVWGGIVDTAAFFELLASKPQVKAFIYGHSHNWSISERAGIKLINLPPVAYVFGAGKPNGWVHARFQPEGVELKLHTLDAAHPQSGEFLTIKWS